MTVVIPMLFIKTIAIQYVQINWSCTWTQVKTNIIAWQLKNMQQLNSVLH